MAVTLNVTFCDVVEANIYQSTIWHNLPEDDE
jgi:hypothetical protein